MRSGECSGFPTLPSARSISNSKLPCVSFSFLASGGVGSGGEVDSQPALLDFLAPPSEFMMKDDEFVEGDLGEEMRGPRSSAGGRDAISLARARDIVGTVHEEMIGATVSLIDGKTYHSDQVQCWPS